MNFLRKILFPFAILYGFVTWFRNFLFDNGVLKSYSFKVPVIAVGNLSVGGTGKTPQIEYLIRLLSEKHQVATLSRGYKRKSEGFILADSHSNAEILGDEPFQFYRKFPNIQVAVDADRKNGIERLLEQTKTPEIILLDDAFQHRKVKAGFYILLTAYGDLYADDWMLPTGNLREGRKGAGRAKAIVVTKCPPNLSEQEQEEIWKKINPAFNQTLYFSFTAYDNQIMSEHQKINVIDIRNTEKLLLAGIAKPKPFFDHLQGEKDVVMNFPDHHHFSESDLSEIKNKAAGKMIITTEKDYVRLKGQLPEEQLFYLPIKSEFLKDQKNFDQQVLGFTSNTLK